MDNSAVGSLQEIRKAAAAPAARKTKSKKRNNSKPFKVVYISNPMKVKTSASEFRALVQELTGQDAELPDPTKFITDNDDGVGGDNQTVSDAAKDSPDDHEQEVPRVKEQTINHHEQQYSTDRAHDRDFPNETFEEVFTPQMLENLTGFLPPGLFCYEQ